jgi:protocatechuate 3,4-dioxygenase beta subunit
MSHKLRPAGSVLLLVMALLLLAATQVWAQGPGDVGEGEYVVQWDEYVVQLESPDDEAEAAQAWLRTERILSDLQAIGMVQRFEVAKAENTLFVSASPEGLRQLQKLAWVTKIERQAEHALEVVYDAQPSEGAGKTMPVAPNMVSGVVDLPDGTPVQNIWVYADEVASWGSASDSTNASGMYSLTLDTDGWWDIYLGSVPFPHNTSYARPPDWSRRLDIDSNIVQDFSLIPISYTITGTVRMTGTGALMQNVQVDGDRTDGGHSPWDSTDLNGVYELDVTTGTYTVTVAAAWSSGDGYAPPFGFAGERVAVPGASVGDVDLWVWPMDKVISGTVTDKDTGEPIGDAQLDLERTDGLYNEYSIGTETSGLTGTYAVSVTSGVYEVSLDTWNQPAGYALPPMSTQVVTVIDSDVPDVDFQLLPMNKSISGRVVVRNTDTGVAGVQMNLYYDWTNHYTPTTATGYYTFTNLPEGNYTVYVDTVPAGYAALPPTYQQVEMTTTNRSGIDFEMLAADKTIRGTVREAGGDGIAGVYVYAYAYDSGYSYYVNTTTDVSGTYTLTVPSGTFDVYVTLPSGYAGPQNLKAPHDATGVDFDLHKQSETITGQVTDHEGTPLAGAYVDAYNYDCYGWDWGGYDAYATTDGSGTYTLTVLPGTYEVQAYKTGYPTPPYRDAQGGDSGVDFTMPEGFHIRGQVWSIAPAGGTLVLPNAYVSAENTTECASSRHDASTYADANGYYTLTVDAGTYAVSAYRSTYTEPPAQSVTVGPDRDDVNFELSPLHRITGTVRYPNGQPVQYDAWVRTTAGPMYDADWSDGDGQYELWVSPGTYDVAAEVWNWPDAGTITGVVVISDTGGVDFTAPAAYTVTGTVRHSDGTPADGTGVNAEELGPPYEDEWDWTDAEGTYALRVRQGGTYEFYLDTSEAGPTPVSHTVSADMTGVDFQYLDVVTVTGMVSDTFGNPVPNVDVDIYGYGTNDVWNWEDAYSFFDGTYVGFLAEGDYTARAEKDPCYVDSRQTFTMGVGGASGVDLTLAPMCSAIAGRVTGPQDDPVCGADVEIWYPGVAMLDEVLTAEDWHGPAGIGTYRVLVPIGTWELTVSKEGYGDPQPLMRTVEITMCNTLVTGQDFQFTISEYIYLPLVMRNS